MNKRLLQHLILSTVVAAAVVGIFIFSSTKEKSEYRLNQFDLSQIQGVEIAEFKRSPVPHLVLQNKDTKLKKYVFSTADCGIAKHGYKGWVEIFVVFNSQGKIDNIILGQNVETPKLIKRMRQRGFFQQWNGRKNPKVQYVTGATYSCKAVSDGIAELLDLLKHETFFR